MSSMLAPEERVLSTLNADGSRRWLDPKPVKGPYRKVRKILAWILIVLFMALPHIHVGGKQWFFIDVAGGEFTFFGATFLRTDTLLLALAMITVFVSIFLVTALFGRVWCGWACPQTVYLEFLYRPLERLFDGKGRKGLRGLISGTPKPVRATIKWSLVILISFHLSNTFLAYFVGSRTVFEWSLQPPWTHPAGFAFVGVVTGLMVYNFGFFREQLCFIACPYGRFQSVLLDDHSLIVGYDTKRGEPRGHKAGRKRRARRAKNTPIPAQPGPAGTQSGGHAKASGCGPCGGAPAVPATGTLVPITTEGDCVDCGLCVAVCPTGIDIREGLQLECIHCTRCMDACDGVMEKVGKDKGLIRYSSQAILAGKGGRFLRPRVIAYPLVLAFVMTALIVLSATHAPADVKLIRAKGQPFYVLPTGEISNQIRVSITNRSDGPRTYSIEPGIDNIRIETEMQAVDVSPGEMVSVSILLIADPSILAGKVGVARVPLVISDDQGFTETQDCKILGPMNISATASTNAKPDQEPTP